MSGGDGSIAGYDRIALVVLGAKPGRAHGGHYGQELLEGHLQIDEAALAENPSVVIEDLVGNHQRQPRQARDDREAARLDVRRFHAVALMDSSIDNDARLA